MIIKVAIPNQIQLKVVPRFKSMFLAQKGEIHYIGGSEILPPPLNPLEESEAIHNLSTEQEQQAKATLIEHNLRLVVYIAKKFDNTGVGVEDLISIGTIGLIKAINTFNSGKNIKLATYASRCIENEILMYFRSQRKLQGELSLSDSLDAEGDGSALSLMDVVCVDDDMLERLDLRDACGKVRRCVETSLTPREAKIIRLRYGLDDRQPLTQREIATLCGISRSYVSRIEKRALEKLRDAYESS